MPLGGATRAWSLVRKEDGPHVGPVLYRSLPRCTGLGGLVAYGQASEAGMSSGPSAGAAKNVATNTVTPSVAFRALWTCP